MNSVWIFVDNKLAIDLAKNLVFHSHSKHIKIHCHYVRMCVHDREVEIIHFPTNKQRANILTKSLGREKFHFFRDLIGLFDIGNANEIKGDNVGK